ncbi:MAG: FKBP-type peptidyl-prolyl cis-trans isomerase [Fluviicola sp.]|nr:FKBP-type peptidyl-prolyl cis-trans isomerase [Fluviicola sp.]
MKYLYLFLVFAACFAGCAKKKAEKQAKEDDEIIQQYIADHGLTTAYKTESGLYVVIDTPGTGSSCTSNSTVKVAYTGYFTNGTIFDESLPAGIQFGLQSVIKGWQEGIPHFKEGGVGKLLVPSALAYGKNGTSGIPANSVLIFDIHLIDVL